LDPLSGRFTDYIVIDTETTGLSVRKGARLIEIGAVKIHNDELVDEFDQLINPFEHVPSRITGLTGIDDSMLLGKPDVREVMDEFARWCSDTAVVMAHNASFDMSFLDNAVQLAYADRDARFAHHFVDTLDLSRRLHPEKRSHKVSTLIVDYHIADMEEHRALSDAKQEWMLYRAMRDEAELLGML
jgi:DNA polymerase III epsilon subunit family exonuclease